MNLDPSWKDRFWVKSERAPLPLLYDRSETGPLRCAKELGNVAISPIPSGGKYGMPAQKSVLERGLMVSIKASSSPRKRLASHCAIGTLNATIFERLLLQQPEIPVSLPATPCQQAHTIGVAPVHTLEQNRHWRTAREDYHFQLQRVEKNHIMYDSIKNGELWQHPLKCLHGWLGRDSRLVFKAFRQTFRPCLLGYRKRRKGGSILFLGCLSTDLPGVILGRAKVRTLSLQGMMWSLPVRGSQRKKNLMPLVLRDGSLWTDGKSNNIWLMDASGNPSEQPTLNQWRVTVEQSGTSIAAAKTSTRVQDCNAIASWRGNGPLINFADRLWFGVVHKWTWTNQTKLNSLGRSYFNRGILFESDVSDGLPRRCFKGGLDSAGHDLFQAHPELGFEWPFAFVMGIVYMGAVHKYAEGCTHRFMIAAGLDDFKPAVTVFRGEVCFKQQPHACLLPPTVTSIDDSLGWPCIRLDLPCPPTLFTSTGGFPTNSPMLPKTNQSRPRGKFCESGDGRHSLVLITRRLTNEEIQ
eukprot:scaffold1_cov375-Pavlova_lutheri.AAC.29